MSRGAKDVFDFDFVIKLRQLKECSLYDDIMCETCTINVITCRSTHQCGSRRFPCVILVDLIHPTLRRIKAGIQRHALMGVLVSQ